jgi:MFS transporter, OPA family, sugar phosphate sensor protein UhpC
MRLIITPNKAGIINRNALVSVPSLDKINLGSLTTSRQMCDIYAFKTHGIKYPKSTHQRHRRSSRRDSNSTTTAMASSSAAFPLPSSSSTTTAVVPLNELPGGYPKDFIIRRLGVFVGIVFGYAMFYLTRLSLTYAAPVMVADPTLGLDITQIGAMTSIFPIAYGMSKFLSGVLGARTSPTILLAGGLMATALMNAAFGFGTSLAWFCFFWGLNGMLQGLGGPSCARILTSWFATKERGTYWGMWNIAHNLGGFAAPVFAGSMAKMYGWQWGMWAPAVAGFIMGGFILLTVRDSPESVGYAPVERVENGALAEKKKRIVEGEGEGEEVAATTETKPSLIKMLVDNVLTNPFIWGMALTYFFIYIVRQGVTSWFVFYLIKVKGVADAGSAALRVSGLELGGLFGSLIAGRLSDAMIARAGNRKGHVGQRVRVVFCYTIGVAFSLLAFAATPASMGWLQWVTVFMIGFFLYGPQMLIGLCGAELVGPASVGASEGFLGWVAYLGAANAGIPLSIIVRDWGWGWYFATLLFSCAMALLLLAPMVKLKSHVQRVGEKME